MEIYKVYRGTLYFAINRREAEYLQNDDKYFSNLEKATSYWRELRQKYPRDTIHFLPIQIEC